MFIGKHVSQLRATVTLSPGSIRQHASNVSETRCHLPVHKMLSRCLLRGASITSRAAKHACPPRTIPSASQNQAVPPRDHVLSCRTLMWPCELDAMHDPPRRHHATLLRNWFASGFSLSR